MAKQLLFSVTKDDCRWDYYIGSGKGGQKRNKTSNCCRCTHIISGAVGKAEDGRSQIHNRRLAFRRMYDSKEFQNWLRIEIARHTGEKLEIEKKVEKELKNILIETHDENGKWVKTREEDLIDE